MNISNIPRTPKQTQPPTAARHGMYAHLGKADFAATVERVTAALAAVAAEVRERLGRVRDRIQSHA